MRRADGVVLEGAEVRIAAAVFRLFVRQLERTEGGASPELREMRDRLEGFAAETRDGAPFSANTGHRFAREGDLADIALIVPQSAPMTVRDAGRLLGISEQSVRARCRSRTLAAVMTRGGWEIDADSAAELAARRKGSERDGQRA